MLSQMRLLIFFLVNFHLQIINSNQFSRIRAVAARRAISCANERVQRGQCWLLRLYLNNTVNCLLTALVLMIISSLISEEKNNKNGAKRSKRKGKYFGRSTAQHSWNAGGVVTESFSSHYSSHLSIRRSMSTRIERSQRQNWSLANYPSIDSSQIGTRLSSFL